jgi:hypothetical protein
MLHVEQALQHPIPIFSLKKEKWLALEKKKKNG